MTSLVLIALLQAGEPATPKGADRDLLLQVRGIATRVEELRGEPFDRPPLAVRAAETMQEAAAARRVERLLDAERLAARGRAWADVGLGLAATPASLYATLARDLPGLAVDPEDGRLLIASGWLDSGTDDPESSAMLLVAGVRPEEPLIGHALMHVRQRERAGGDFLEPTTDGLLARAAWAEGEANLLAVRFLFAGMDLADAVLQHAETPGAFLDGRLVPPPPEVLLGTSIELTRFVFEEGFAQAVGQYNAGGWPAVARAMRTRSTTRDLLHPDRPPLGGGGFGAPAAPREGLRLVDEDSLGEQGVVVLISRLTGKDNLALQAGDGWAGDRLYRWEGEGDQGLTVWVTRWASEADLEDFDYSLGRALAARFPGRALAAGADGVRSLSTEDRLFQVERRGAELWLTVLPSREPPRLD